MTKKPMTILLPAEFLQPVWVDLHSDNEEARNKAMEIVATHGVLRPNNQKLTEEDIADLRRTLMENRANRRALGIEEILDSFDGSREETGWSAMGDAALKEDGMEDGGMSYLVEIEHVPTKEVRVWESGIEWDDESGVFLWEEGNFSCDCNRSRFFHEAGGEDAPSDQPCGYVLFRIVSIKSQSGELLYSEPVIPPDCVHRGEPQTPADAGR